MKNILKQSPWLLLILCILLSVGCTGNNSVKPISKSQEEMLRSKYEVLLFNHLRTRGEWPLDKRFRSIKQMADEGFESAALALKLFDIEHSDLKRNDTSAQKRLEQLAEQGNPTAQCLYAFYWEHYNFQDERGERWRRYVTQASNHGVAHCMHLRAISLERNHLNEQINLKFEAAHKGDLYAQSGMAFYYEKGLGVEKDLAKATCWAIEAQKSNTDWGRGLYKDMAFFYTQENPNGLQKLTPEFCNAAISVR
ncbi:MAG: hypothetical protein Q7T21_03205 [Gallionella sp.]|nr:hypothetical protein [Gallionella sp.]